MSYLGDGGMPTIYQYLWPAQPWLVNNQPFNFGGIRYEAQVSATTRQTASTIASLTAGQLHVKINFTDLTSVETDVFYTDLQSSATADGNQVLSFSIMDIQNEAPGLDVPVGKTISGGSIQVVTPFAGAIPSPDAATYVELAVTEYFSHDPNHVVPGGYHPIAARGNTAGTTTQAGLSYFVYDVGQVPGYPQAATYAMIKLSLQHTSGSAFVPTGGGVVVINLVAALTQQDVALAGVASINAQTASTFTADPPSSGTSLFRAKNSGASTNTGIGGTFSGDLTVIQRGADAGPPSSHLSTSPLFLSTSTQIFWTSSTRQQVVLKNGINYLDLLAGPDGTICRLDLVQPPSGAAGTANYTNQGGDALIKVVGITPPALASANSRRNQLVVQYYSNYNGSPTYVVTVGGETIA